MSPSLLSSAERIRHCTVVVEGVVQGVGFRPFVYRLAHRHSLHGSVRNALSGVLIEVEGDRDRLAEFLDELVSKAPAVARPRCVTVTWHAATLDATSFSIDTSVREAAGALFPAPDLALCASCARELGDPADRRHRYPFLNCTGCGPRFTIIRALPYDRERTSMARFTMCRACHAEYDDPGDRRFHAEPTACPRCGPALSLLDADGRAMAAHPVEAATAALRAGKILALKGLGGYHLACNATSAAAVATLRRRKGREAKPLAVMVATLEAVRALCTVSHAEAELLSGTARPIVLLARRADGRPRVAHEVAPRLRELGVMLPYTPLHYLLLDAVGVPLVMTSGNVSDEPIAHEDADALSRLKGIADLFLVHDRPIQVRCDDSIARVVAGGSMVIRRARGYVPLAIPLPHAAARPILAVGGELKNTVALVRGRDAFLSQHLGDLADPLAWRAWLDTVTHFEQLLDVAPVIVAHDLHPGYRTTAYARSLDGIEPIAVQHHHAHIASCLADNAIDTRVIGVAWDGTGYGGDGHIWGGEVLVADLGGYERAGHFQEVPLAGGDAAIREPWRMAAVFLSAAYGKAMASLDLDFVRRLDRPAWRILTRAIERGLNAPPTSSAGRLFDAVASLIGLRDRVDFEAQAVIELEAMVESSDEPPYPVDIEGLGKPFVVRTVDGV